ncbi:MAG: capsular polysaccharide synthesis protein [Bacteroidota bacterium]
MQDLPKNIWTYWHQGFEDAPLVVKSCVAQIQKLHPDWTIHLLNRDNIGDFIDPIPIQKDKWEKLLLPHRSDLIRTQLLIKYGGVWIDPTCFPVQSLSVWLAEYMTADVFFFAHPGRARVISNWFIAAQKGNYLLKKLYTELCEYWHYDFTNLRGPASQLEKLTMRAINRSPNATRLWFTPLFTKLIRWSPYMIYHYKFYDLSCSDKKCQEIWDAMPKFPAQKPHQLQQYGLLDSADETIKAKIDTKDSPLFKLTWKLPQGEIPKDSVLHYLMASN